MFECIAFEGDKSPVRQPVIPFFLDDGPEHIADFFFINAVHVKIDFQKISARIHIHRCNRRVAACLKIRFYPACNIHFRFFFKLRKNSKNKFVQRFFIVFQIQLFAVIFERGLFNHRHDFLFFFHIAQQNFIIIGGLFVRKRINDTGAVMMFNPERNFFVFVVHENFRLQFWLDDFPFDFICKLYFSDPLQAWQHIGKERAHLLLPDLYFIAAVFVKIFERL